MRLFYGSYPITPASDILHELAQVQELRRDAPSRPRTRSPPWPPAIGAAFGGALGVTATSGPGIALKGEAIGPGGDDRAAARDRQRAARRPVDRPADQDRAGRPLPGDVRPQRRVPRCRSSPRARRPTASTRPSRPAASPSTTWTPVILLSDGYLANGAEPWLVARTSTEPADVQGQVRRTDPDGGFMPYKRDETLARPWAIPGTPGLEHRIGGLEKHDVTGNVSYDAGEPREHGAHARREGRSSIAQDIPRARARGARAGRRAGDRLGRHLRRASRQAVDAGAPAGHARSATRTCATSIPLPHDLGEVHRSATRSARARAQHGPAALMCCAPSILVDAWASTRSRASRSRSARSLGRSKSSLARNAASHASTSKRRSPNDSAIVVKLTKKDFVSPTRKCAGARAAATTPSSPTVQKLMPELGIARENTVFVCGIGCSQPLPVLHEHVRLPHASTAARRPSPPASRWRDPISQVWVVTGDGDALSIGGNHLIHVLRRNVDLKILLFNNRIYGLTKGQYSPTSRARQEDQVDAVRLGRPSLQSAVAGARRGRDLRGAHRRHRRST